MDHTPIQKNAGENLSVLEHTLWRHGQESGQLIPLLQQAQEEHGYISQETIKNIANVTKVPESDIYGVITFYTQFRLKPLGRFLLRLCDGTACHVNNSLMLQEIILDELKLAPGEDTTADGLFTFQPVACLGCCSLAPVIMINDETFGRLTPAKLRQILKDFKARGKKTQEAAQ